MKIIRENLKLLRLEKHLTQESVAEVLKVSRVVYNRYETGERSIDIVSLIKLADFYNVSLDYLFGRVNY